MAIIDDLVASGLSLPQAQKVIDFNAGVGTESDFVAQGFSGVQAVAIYDGAPTEAELANAGFSIPQESSIIDALAYNDAPVANAGPNQSVAAGSAVDLDGSGSYDPNGDPLDSYEWTLTSKPAGSTAALDDDTLVDPSFTADKVGAYVATLVVSDGTLESAPSTVTITAINTAPTANAGANQTVAKNDEVSLDGSGSSDPQGDTLTYAWTLTTKPSESTATLTGPTTETPSFTADKLGAYVVSLVVNDGSLSSTPSTVTVTAVNVAPTADAGPDQTVETGDLVELDGSGSSDPDGDELTYAWTLTSKPEGSTAALADSTTETPSFTADLAGAYVVSLVVNDGTASSAPNTVTITAEDPPGES